MRTLSPLFVTLAALLLPFAGAAQTVGLPDQGIEVTGDTIHPILVNHSHRAVIAYTVRYEDSTGRGPVFHFVLYGDKVAKDGGIKNLNIGLEVKNPTQPDYGPFTKAQIVSVVFEDGEFVGTDKYRSYTNLSSRLELEGTKVWRKTK
jgi:hypothetical protein